MDDDIDLSEEEIPKSPVDSLLNEQHKRTLYLGVPDKIFDLNNIYTEFSLDAEARGKKSQLKPEIIDCKSMQKRVEASRIRRLRSMAIAIASASTARIIGYARTSTTEQEAGLADQKEELERAGAHVIYEEQESSVANRPVLNTILGELQPGDCLMVTKMDRLVRSTKELLLIVDDLNSKHVGLCVLSMRGEALDTRNPTSKFLLTILAGVATLEREIMLERQRPGIEKARAEGKYKGKKPRPQHLVDSVVELYQQGLNQTQIAKKLGVSRWVPMRVLGPPKPRKDKAKPRPINMPVLYRHLQGRPPLSELPPTTT